MIKCILFKTVENLNEISKSQWMLGSFISENEQAGEKIISK